MQKIVPLALSFLLVSSAAAQNWEIHRQSVLAQPALIRYHIFDGALVSPNLAPFKDTADSDLVYKTQHPKEPGTERYSAQSPDLTFIHPGISAEYHYTWDSFVPSPLRRQGSSWRGYTPLTRFLPAQE